MALLCFALALLCLTLYVCLEREGQLEGAEAEECGRGGSADEEEPLLKGEGRYHSDGEVESAAEFIRAVEAGYAKL